MLLESVDHDAAAPTAMPAYGSTGHAIESPCNSCRRRESSSCGALFGDIRREGALRRTHRATSARHNIQRAGEVTDGTLVICEGWAVRYVQLPNGKRQVLSVIMPGDVVSATSVFDTDKRAFSVQAVTKVQSCQVRSQDIRARIANDPSVMNKWTEFAIEELRDADGRLVDLGQRSASERIASLILKIMARLEKKGEVRDLTFPFPLRQQHIADLTGLTPVHVCRVLGAFRKDGIFQVDEGLGRVGDRGLWKK